ncbi:outer membrane protein assembly factor BamA [Candidatus Omnitrophota bacterium]
MIIKKRIYIIHIAVSIVTLVSILLLPAYSQDSSEPASQEITDITIEENKIVSTNNILSKIKLKTGDIFSQKAVNEDIKRLYATGFFTDVTAQIEDYEGGIRLIFSVLEKSVVEKIIFKGNEIYKEGKLAKVIETKEGDVLNKRRLSEDLKKIKAFYKKKGFPLVEADYDINLDAGANKAKVLIIIDEKKRYRIKNIRFEGNEGFPDKRLLKLLSTRVDALFTSGFLDESTLEQDMDRIGAFYKTQGYIDADASYQIEYGQDEKRIDILITVEEGDQYFVGALDLVGNLVITSKQINKELRMKTGDSYNPDNLRFDVMGIQTLYFDKGYMSCKVRPATKLDSQAKTISISYGIAEGSVSYVNDIRVTGNTKTKDLVIRRELRLYPGEQFDGKKLKRSKERLYNLGFFDEVIFNTEPTQTDDKRDLVVSVKEAKTGELSFGGGYSSVDRLLGFVEVMQRNFDIGNYPDFTGAGQSLKIRAEIGSVRQNYILSFTEPWIFGYPYLFGFDLFNYDRSKKSSLGYGYGERRFGGALRFGKEFTDYDRADLKYRLERIKISDVSADATDALKDEEGNNTISSLGLTLTRDTTDNKFNPMRGHILSATGEDAGGFLGGDKDFYKLFGLANVFFNYDKKLVLDLKLRVGWSDEYDDSKSVPVYERFFAGGANTIRGYKERRVGPRDAKTDDPVGGESMLIGNIEATYPVIKNFKIAAFYDIGNVWEKSDDLASGDYKSAIGTGVRVKTPIGPVKIDMGYPLKEAAPGEKKKVRFHFSMSKGF